MAWWWWPNELLMCHRRWNHCCSPQWAEILYELAKMTKRCHKYQISSKNWQNGLMMITKWTLEVLWSLKSLLHFGEIISQVSILFFFKWIFIFIKILKSIVPFIQGPLSEHSPKSHFYLFFNCNLERTKGTRHDFLSSWKVQHLYNEGSNFILSSLEVGHWAAHFLKNYRFWPLSTISDKDKILNLLSFDQVGYWKCKNWPPLRWI